jgi:cellulose 1,4-beta-cellobiosidase
VFAEAHQVNPYVGATQYVNPLWKAEVESEAVAQPSLATKMRVVENQPTAVWLDSMGAIAGPSGGMGLAAHLNAALTQKGSGPEVVNIIIYDLPGRDCNALASNGELPATAAGLTTYETSYIDPIVAILSNSAYANLRISAVIEPDSLPNIVTNSGVAACQTAGPFYEAGIEYALNKLHAIGNVYNFVDSAHSGWLGWTSNSGPAANEFAKVARATTAGMASIDGFITDTANTTPLQEQFITASSTVNGSLAINAAGVGGLPVEHRHDHRHLPQRLGRSQSPDRGEHEHSRRYLGQRDQGRPTTASRRLVQPDRGRPRQLPAGHPGWIPELASIRLHLGQAAR